MNYKDGKHLCKAFSHHGKNILKFTVKKGNAIFICQSFSMTGDNKIKWGLFTTFNNIYKIKSMLNSFVVN